MICLNAALDMVIAFPIYMCECVVVNCTCSVLVMHYVYVTLFSVMKYAKKELEEKDFVVFTEKIPYFYGYKTVLSTSTIFSKYQSSRVVLL